MWVAYSFKGAESILSLNYQKKEQKRNFVLSVAKVVPKKNKKTQKKHKKPDLNPRKVEPLNEKSYELSCPHFDECSGCSLETSLDKPPILEEAKIFFKNYGISNFTLHTGDVHSWRCRAKLAVRRGSDGSVVIGLYQEGTHDVVDIPQCKAHHPAINAAVELLKQKLQQFEVEPYDERTERGSLRYIQLVLHTLDTSIPVHQRYNKGRVQLSLVVNSRGPDSAESAWLRPLCGAMWRDAGPSSPHPLIHSLWANFQTSSTNVIFGARWRHLAGPKVLWENLGGVDLAFSPGAFGQANYSQFSRLLSALHSAVPPSCHLAELYGGAGALGLSLVKARGCHLTCVEVNSHCELAFSSARERLPPELRERATWHCADAGVSPTSWLKGADVALVDPPRRGLDRALLEGLCALPRGKVGKWPQKLIYISCGWSAFKRDCAELAACGWAVDSAQAFQFFPGTNRCGRL